MPSPVRTQPDPTGVLTRSPTALRILRASAQLFASKGFSATSTRDIADAVGIRQPGLYKHFSSKDAILIALYDLAFGYPTEVSRVLHRHPAPAAVRLHRWLRETLEHLSPDAKVLASLISTPELNDPRFAPHRFAPDLGQRFCERLVRLGTEEGAFLRRSPASQAWLTLALVDAMAIPVGNPATTEEILRHAFDGLLVDRRTYPSIVDRSARIELGISSPSLVGPAVQL